METSGQLHFLGEKSVYKLDRGSCEPPRSVWSCWYRRQCLLLSGIEPNTLMLELLFYTYKTGVLYPTLHYRISQWKRLIVRRMHWIFGRIHFKQLFNAGMTNFAYEELGEVWGPSAALVRALHPLQWSLDYLTDRTYKQAHHLKDCSFRCNMNVSNSSDIHGTKAYTIFFPRVQTLNRTLTWTLQLQNDKTMGKERPRLSTEHIRLQEHFNYKTIKPRVMRDTSLNRAF